METYSVIEDELLCDAWFSVSTNFLIMKQAGMSFWETVHSWFHEQKQTHNEYYSLHLHIIRDRNAKSLAHWWHAIYNYVDKYRCAVSQVNRTMSPGASAMEIAERVEVLYQRKEDKALTLMHCWFKLRERLLSDVFYPF